MDEKKVKVSDSVVLIPSKSAEDLRHNYAKEVPAIVCATFKNPKLVNARVFVDGFHVPAWATSMPHQSEAAAGSTCWRFPDEPVKLPESDERENDFLEETTSAEANANANADQDANAGTTASTSSEK